MTFREFMNHVEDVRIVMRWRKGQAVFNTLLKVKVKLAESLRGTPLDPFFKDPPSAAYKESIAYIERVWNDEEFS